MRIILVTHGQTVENATHTIQGQRIGGQLTEVGREQARAIGERLRDARIGAAYSSDLSRAVQTADEIIRYHPGLQLSLAKELRERDYGECSGRTMEEVGWRDEWVVQDRPGFETIGDMCSRVGAFLARIRELHGNDTVLLVCHRDCGRALECVAKGLPPSGFADIEEMGNGDVRTFDA